MILNTDDLAIPGDVAGHCIFQGEVATLPSISNLKSSRWWCMTTETSVLPAVITVLLANSKPMESQLLAGSLRHRGFEVLSCDGEVSSILEFVESGTVKIAVISCSATHSGLPDMTALRTLHLTHPEIPKICLDGD